MYNKRKRIIKSSSFDAHSHIPYNIVCQPGTPPNPLFPFLKISLRLRNYLWHKEDEEKASQFTWKGRQPPFTAGSSKGPPPNQPLHRRPHKRRRVRFRWGLVWIFKDSAEAKWHSSNTILWKSSAYNYINRLSEDGYCICCHCTRKMMQNLRSGPKSPEKFCFVTVSFCMFAGRMMISVQVSRFWFLSHLSLLLRLFLSGICPSSRLYTGEHVMVTIISLYCDAAEVFIHVCFLSAERDLLKILNKPSYYRTLFKRWRVERICLLLLNYHLCIWIQTLSPPAWSVILE